MTARMKDGGASVCERKHRERENTGGGEREGRG